MLLLSPVLLAQGTPPKPATPAPGAKPAAATAPAPAPAAAPAPADTPDTTSAASPSSTDRLTEDQRKVLVGGLGEVANYIRGVRNLEALDKLNELETAVGPVHLIENLRGAVYTKMRDFSKARTHFQKAQELAKGNDREAFHPKFNLAELDFVEAANNAAKLREVPPRKGVDPAAVTKQWAAGHDAFTKLLKDPGLGEKDTGTLINFKIFICNLFLKREADAEVILTTFDQFDSNAPAYYYARAVQEFMKDDKDKAQGWMDSAKRIYPKETNEVYNDTLVELGWLETLQ